MNGVQPSEFWLMSPKEVLFWISVKAKAVRRNQQGTLNKKQIAQIEATRKRLEDEGVNVV